MHIVFLVEPVELFDAVFHSGWLGSIDELITIFQWQHVKGYNTLSQLLLT